MELKREEYEFLILQHRSHGYSFNRARRIVGRNCEQIEDIALDPLKFNLGTTSERFI